MPVDTHLTAPRAPPVSEYLIARLFGEGLLPASRIKAEELAGVETQADLLAKGWHITQGAHITAVDLVRLLAAIWTFRGLGT